MTQTVDKVRVGLLGWSDIASRKMFPALCTSQHAVLEAIASRVPEQVPPGIARVCDYQALLDDPHIELVYISLPNHLHEEWCVRALAAGKDVLCEKPLGLTQSSVGRMLATAEKHGVLLCENLMFLQHPQHALVRELVAAGEIGELKALRSVFTIPGLAAGNFRLDPQAGGGAFHDLSRYPLGIADYFLQGELLDFHGVALERDGLRLAMQGSVLTTSAELFSFAIGFEQQYESSYELIGSQGKIRVDRAYTTPADLCNQIVLTRNQEQEIRLAPAADHFQLLLDDFCQAIAGNRQADRFHEQSRRMGQMAELMQKGCRHDP